MSVNSVASLGTCQESQHLGGEAEKSQVQGHHRPQSGRLSQNKTLIAPLDFSLFDLLSGFHFLKA